MSKVKQQQLDENLIAGWILCSETWTRTGNHTFTVAGDLTAKYRKGAKVRYKDGGAYEYGTVISSSYSSPNTTVTLATNTDFVMAATTITDTYISYIENPEGCPDWFTFVPIVSGAITAGIGTYTTQAGRFTLKGKLCTFQIYIIWTNHTGTGGLRFSVPIPPRASNPLQAITIGFVSNYTFPSTYSNLIAYLDNTWINLGAIKESGISDSAMDTSANFILGGNYEIA